MRTGQGGDETKSRKQPTWLQVFGEGSVLEARGEAWPSEPQLRCRPTGQESPWALGSGAVGVGGAGTSSRSGDYGYTGLQVGGGGWG